MKWTSTRNKSLRVPFSEAILNCVPKDGGFYIPSETQDLRRWILYTSEETSFNSIAGSLTSAFINDEFSPIICETIITGAFKFAPEIRQLDDNLFLMELFHGPTGMHRDFGISFLASCFETIFQLNGGNAIFLDASSGNLGATLSYAVRGKKNVKAVIVYPKGLVRGVEESDLFWNGGNVYPIEMEADEQVCFDTVREILKDYDFVKENRVTVANTANIGRLLPQTFFYPYAFSRIKNKTASSIFYALSPGNYSNVVAGLYAWQFALPLNGFITPVTSAISCDASGEPILLDSFVPLEHRYPSDLSEPSNIERLENIFSANKAMMKYFLYPYQLDEKDITEAAKELFMKYKIYADRDTARAFAAAKQHEKNSDDETNATVLIANDSPCLQKDFVRRTIGEAPEIDERLLPTMKKVEVGRKCVKSADEVKKVIKRMWN